MAKINDDSILNHMLGMLGKQLVIKRSKSGKRYISAVPEYDPNRKLTPAQAAYKKRFKRNAAYGKRVSSNPELKKLYMEKLLPGCTPYIMAWRDAQHRPVITNVLFEGYHGRENDIIIITAEDDFKVASVQVFIYDIKGALIEKGDASHQNLNIWSYLVKTNTKGSNIEVKAFDMPGNETSASIKL
jgi:hypothetical protein